jgi:hypothetical protein
VYIQVDSCSDYVAVSATEEDADDEAVVLAAEDADDESLVNGAALPAKLNHGNTSEASILLLLAESGKKRRCRSAIKKPLEDKVCRGLCGNVSKCLSKRTAEGGEPTLEHCVNYKLPYKCPLWVGVNCATQFKSNKCRICDVIDHVPPFPADR